MLKKQKTIGRISTKPGEHERQSAFVKLFAVNIRCTMSWSVPCVAMVMKMEPSSAAQIVYSLPKPRTARMDAARAAPSVSWNRCPVSKICRSCGC